MTTLKFIWSDRNGLQSDKAYHKRPLESEIKKAINNDLKFKRKDGTFIFLDKEKTIVEVKRTAGNFIAGNTYRDLYRIIE